MDRIDEEEWMTIREELWDEKVPLQRICGGNAVRARMACKVQARCGEHGLWDVSAGAESAALKRSMCKSGYKCIELKARIFGETAMRSMWRPRVWEDVSVRATPC